MKTQIVTGSKNREHCGACGKILDLNEKTACKCSQCGAELLTRDEFYAYLTEGECFIIKKTAMTYTCNECSGRIVMNKSDRYSFCPHCGRRIIEVLEPIDSVDDLTNG